MYAPIFVIPSARISLNCITPWMVSPVSAERVVVHEHVDPMAELLLVFLGHAKQVADDHRRDAAREVPDEVELRPAVELVEEGAAELAKATFEVGDLSRRDSRVDDVARCRWPAGR